MAAVGQRTGWQATDERRSEAAQAVEQVRSLKVRWVELFYTDLLGGFNHLHLPAETLTTESFATGIPKLDGSSVKGFREIYESDMILVPDPSTMATIPWASAQGGSVRFIADILVGASREPYSHDPRGSRAGPSRSSPMPDTTAPTGAPRSSSSSSITSSSSPPRTPSGTPGGARAIS